jgi:hypothetical protein
MSANLVPSSPNNAAAARADGYSPMAQWGGAPSSPPPSSGGGMGEQVARTLAALKRYKWLVIAVIAVGSTAGFILTRFVSPKYDVSASIWIAATSGKERTIGPVSHLASSTATWHGASRGRPSSTKVVKLALYVYPDIE